ncbi:hypothetical protein [Urbifossiella limnaea]|uniref:TIGR03000 domain-containing protein n=1 Tax=Urbifossiella limnaea TaxID=2528023 RepID=A0A517XY49_9BACT|nr:hypothetical protein [Urbifossiella limnaea]QDU22447.1 hypothetical protein ETAA1_44270 [Urbifossiella limnaea]
MRHLLLGSLAVIATTTPAGAQFRGGLSPGPGYRSGPAMRGNLGPPAGGGFRMIQAPPPPRSTGFGLGVGVGTPYGIGGGFRSGYGYGYGGVYYGGGYPFTPYYTAPPPIVIGGGATVVPAEPSGAALVSGILPATLVLEYPAPAKVWLDGVEVPGDADTTWTFTSRDLKRGETVTFRVRGRWTANGKTFESEREVPLGPGARSRLLVVSGTEVRE